MRILNSPRDLIRVVIFCLAVGYFVGCAGSPRKEWDRKALAVGAAADAIRIAVSSGHVKDPEALAAMRFGLLTARNALDKSLPLALAGRKEDAAYWYGQIDDALALAAKQYANGANAHVARNDRPGPATRP